MRTRLCLFPCSFQYWFQNRRAKSRKRERKLITDLQSNLSNLTVHPIYGVHSERKQVASQYPSNLFRLSARVCCPSTSSALEETPSLPQPVSIRRHHLSFRPNQFVRNTSVVKSVAAQKAAPTDIVRLHFSRCQPY